MPPDVFLMMASSGIAIVASLMFLVSDEPCALEAPEDPRLWVTFLNPPPRTSAARRTGGTSSRVTVPLAAQLQLQFELGPDQEWLMRVEASPLADSPGLQVVRDAHGVLQGVGQVHDLRWHGRAGLAAPLPQSWRRSPIGRA